MNIALLLRRFTIRTRMFGAIAMVLSLLALIGAAAVLLFVQAERQSERVLRESMASITEVVGLGDQLGVARRIEKETMILHADPVELARFKGQWQQALARLKSGLEHLQASVADADKPLVATMLTQLETYRTAYLAILARVETGGFDGAPAINAGAGEAKTAAKATAAALDALAAALQQHAAHSIATLREQADLAQWLIVAMVVAAMALVAPLTLANLHSIVSPIGHARKVAQAIADGELDLPIRVDGHDEASALLAALARMQTSLRSLVGQVRAAADSIQIASAEVASGNADLSQRTEQAASSLQRTACSVEQLTGNVRQSAESARQANQLAASASAVASQGGSVVAEVVTTMDEINTSSRRIADIIGTIDSIAFQTNILALNAAVEAARAGEQGRGFAVVAGEVRSLAQRTAEAAREIKGLIGASVERVDSGTRLVRDAGATMGEIVSSVQRVTDVIGEISAAATEQSTGIDQVNGAVAQLDQMTQQNAALVQQSAAAAESLNEQAVRLTEVVASFRVGDGTGVIARTAQPPAQAVARSTAAATPATQARSAIERARATAQAAPQRASNDAERDFAAAARTDGWESF